MRVVIQRVSRASVQVESRVAGEIGAGVLVLLGVAEADGDAEADRLAGKVARLRIFENLEGRFDRSLLDTGGAVLVVSQFTLIADTAKGNRPSFTGAAEPEAAERLYERFCAALARPRRRVRPGLRRPDGGRARQRRPGDDRPRGRGRARVKRVLLTGMSGTGKSSVVQELAQRGYKAVDTDDGFCEVQPDGRQLLARGRHRELLATEDADVLFVAGCEENQGTFHPQFDHIVLLSAPLETMVERLETRTNNPYGKSRVEFDRFLEDVENVEPLLRRAADHEVRTDAPLDDVVATILRLVDVE